MRKSRFSEEQIIGILKEQQADVPVAEICRKHGISDATFYTWGSRFGGMEVSDARRLKALDDENRRRDTLSRAGCKKIFEEKKSGKAGTKWPEFEAALAYRRPDDVLVVWKLDRLGRSLVEMMRTIDSLAQQNIYFESLTEKFDSATAMSRYVLQIQGATAEYFLGLNRERTVEGLKAALARGRKGGRRKALGEQDLKVARALLAAGNISIAEIAKRLGISRDTFYSYFPQARAQPG